MMILKGLIIGFIASISIGPIAFKTIQRTLSDGKLRGIIMGFGVAFSDTIFAIIATLSINSVFNIIESYQIPIRIIGGIIVIYIGFQLLRKRSYTQTNESKDKIGTYATDFLSTFLLALSNPLTIVMYAVFFTAFHVIPKENCYIELLMLYLGIFLGANLWWGLIVFSIKLIPHQSWFKNSQRINSLFGKLIIFFGIISLISIFVI